MIIHEPTKSLLLRVKNPSLIAKILPKHKVIAYEGHNIAVRHGLDEVRVLRNLGIQAPPPILHYYGWPGQHTPFSHQKETSAFLTLHRRCFVLNEMGTAKTASALWAADYLLSQNDIHKVLVVAPLSTLERVWMDDIYKFVMHRVGVVLHGTKEHRLRMLASDADFYIINHDGLATIEQEVRARKDIDLVIVDEGAAYRNATTARYKVLQRVMLSPHRRLWIMTGTPCPNAPTDAWATTRLVNPSNVPQYFASWRRMTMLQISQFKWVPRGESYEIAFKAMQPAVRFKKADCLDLPPVTIERRETDLSKEQKRAYGEMLRTYAADIGEQPITAVNAADRINKLRQILCGAIKHPGTDEYTRLDHRPRVETLMECIEQAAAKVIVIVPFKGILRWLAEEVRKEYSLEILNGDVPARRRAEIIRSFTTGTNPHVLLCHPKVMAHGLNLTEADMVVFYAPIYSNEEYQQVQDRINRPGQTRKMTIVRIGAASLEWEIYRMLDSKRVTQENILSLYKHEVLGVE